MVRDPDKYFEGFKKAGAQKVVFHYEAVASNIQETVRRARAHGLRVGMAVNPETPVSAIQPLLGI
ncbi:MAG: ribulose-phosphate 3-epimerase, partial [Dehalococcoidia bacterium]|nr:ribulose-phosphate 3-epimerase [Dehalococcoidia bacterium]